MLVHSLVGYNDILKVFPSSYELHIAIVCHFTWSIIASKSPITFSVRKFFWSIKNPVKFSCFYYFTFSKSSFIFWTPVCNIRWRSFSRWTINRSIGSLVWCWCIFPLPCEENIIFINHLTIIVIALKGPSTTSIILYISCFSWLDGLYFIALFVDFCVFWLQVVQSKRSCFSWCSTFKLIKCRTRSLILVWDEFWIFITKTRINKSHEIAINFINFFLLCCSLKHTISSRHYAIQDF